MSACVCVREREQGKVRKKRGRTIDNKKKKQYVQKNETNTRI